MKIMLIRTKAQSAYNMISPIVVEPLELEYIATLLEDYKLQYFIQDEVTSKRNTLKVFKEEKPQVVIMSGYLNNVSTMISYAVEMKKTNPSTIIIVGGVHAEVNYKDFFNEAIDIVCYSGGYKPLEHLASGSFNKDCFSGIKGICCKGEKGQWKINEREAFNPEKQKTPNRAFFYKNKNKFKYLNLGPCAMIKTSYGCPYSCNFCYCRLLNGGVYIQRGLESVVEEIKSINCKNIWIIDDTFLISRERLIAFAHMVRINKIEKNFIIYSRADFIVKNKDLLPLMKEIGIKQVIVGLEAVDSEELQGFSKGTDKNINENCVAFLKEFEIECIGLFVTHINYKKQDFNKLYKWIKRVGLKLCTFSIYTPLPGTELYEKYKDEIRFHNYDKMDFLHLLIKPTNLSVLKYYFYFYILHLKVYFNTLKLMLFNNEKSIKKQ